MVGARSYLDGEESKSFVTLPVIKNYATLIGALASWDSNLHESDLLNKITPPSERIYLIVKVSTHEWIVDIAKEVSNSLY